MRLLVGLLLLAASGSASADYFSGNDLNQELLSSGRVIDIAMFRGYVAGVQDVSNGQLFCVPEDVPLSQASAIVQKYLSDNPRLWNKPAKDLVVRALRSAYPCGQ
jgi:hypothetical protein